MSKRAKRQKAPSPALDVTRTFCRRNLSRSRRRAAAYAAWVFAATTLHVGLSAATPPVTLTATQVPAPSRIVVEVDQEAQALVDPRVTRRLITLELGDVEVRPPHDAREAQPRHALYVRISVEAPDNLVVELWSRGQLEGERRVSQKGTAQLRARRIALVSAELARALHRRRELAAEQANQRELQARQAAARMAFTIPARLHLKAEVLGTSVGGDAAWLTGPALSFGLQTQSGAAVEMRAEWFGGQQLSPSPMTLQWYALALRPYYVWSLGGQPGRERPDHVLEAGANVTLGGVRISDVAAEIAPAGTLDSWTTRATGDVAWSAVVSPLVRLGVRVEAGAVLHPVTVASAPVSEFGGLWLGGSLTLNVGD